MLNKTATHAASQSGQLLLAGGKMLYDQFSKSHHVKVDDVHRIDEIFAALFEVDPQARQCFAHFPDKSKQSNDKDIVLPKPDRGKLELTQLDAQTEGVLNGDLAIIQQYLLKGLGLSRGKINSANNYHYAIMAGLSNWFHRRLPIWVTHCLTNPQAIDQVTAALLTSLETLSRQKDSKDKQDIANGLYQTIEKHLKPEMQRLVANKSAAHYFHDLAHHADHAAIEGRKLVAALSYANHTAQQPNLAFFHDQGASQGFFCMQVGNKVLGSALTNTVNLGGPLAKPLQEAATLAFQQRIECIADQSLQNIIRPDTSKQRLDTTQQKTYEAQRQKWVKTLHPVCQHETVSQKEKGIRDDTVQPINDQTRLDQYLTDLGTLLKAFSELSALARLFSQFESFANYVGAKAMFSPDQLQATLKVLREKIDATRQTIEGSPLFQHVGNMMADTTFKNQFKHCLHYDHQHQQANLQEQLTAIKTHLHGMKKAMQSIDFKRANFQQVVNDAENYRVAITEGIRRLTGNHQLANTIDQELKAISGITHTADSVPSHKIQQGLKQELEMILQRLCDLYRFPEVKNRRRYAQRLNEIFANTPVIFKETGWFSSSQKLHYQIKTTDDSPMPSLARQLDEVMAHRMMTVQQARIKNQTGIDNAKLAGSNEHYQHLINLLNYMESGQPINTATGRQLVNQCLIQQISQEDQSVKTDAAFRQRMEKLFSYHHYTMIFWELPEDTWNQVATTLSTLPSDKASLEAFAKKLSLEWFRLSDEYILSLNAQLEGNAKFVIHTTSYGRTVSFEIIYPAHFEALQKPEKWKAIRNAWEHDLQSMRKQGKPYVGLYANSEKYQSHHADYQHLKLALMYEMVNYPGMKEAPIMISQKNPDLNIEIQAILDQILTLDKDDKEMDNKKLVEQLQSHMQSLFAIQERENFKEDVDLVQYHNLLNGMIANTSYTFHYDRQKKEFYPRLKKHYKIPSAKYLLGIQQENIMKLRQQLRINLPDMTGNPALDTQIYQEIDAARQISHEMAFQGSHSERLLRHQNRRLARELVAERKECKAKHQKVIDLLGQLRDNASKSKNDLEKVGKRNEEAMEKIKSNQDKLYELNETLTTLTVENAKQKEMVNDLTSSNEELMRKNEELVELLSTSMNDSLIGIKSIIDNCKQSLLTIARLKKDNLGITSKKKAIEVNNKDRKLLELGKEIGKISNQKSFLENAIKELELSIQKNKEIAEELQHKIDVALSKGKSIQIDISKIKVKVYRKLDSINENIKFQSDILQFAKNTITYLEERNQQLEKMVSMIQDENSQLKKEKDAMERKFNSERQRQNAEFEKKFQEKDETIQQLTDEIKKIKSKTYHHQTENYLPSKPTGYQPLVESKYRESEPIQQANKSWWQTTKFFICTLGIGAIVCWMLGGFSKNNTCKKYKKISDHNQNERDVDYETPPESNQPVLNNDGYSVVTRSSLFRIPPASDDSLTNGVAPTLSPH